MKLQSRLVTIALACMLAGGALALGEDLATIRINQTSFVPAGIQSTWFTPPKIAFPGELIAVELGQGWTVPESSDPNVVAPLQTSAGYGYFVAVSLGEATLHARNAPICAGCQHASVLWRTTVNVRIPGT